MAHHQQPGSSLLQVPGNVLQQIVLLLPDPASLAGACHATAALLDHDSLLLDWAQAALAPRSAHTTNPPAASATTEHRHPAYALLHWRRLHCMPTQRLAALLLRWVARCLPNTAVVGDSCRRAQQLLDRYEALTALQALLPHSQHLLLLYAAQAGHTRLLGELLAAPGAAAPLRLQWDADTWADSAQLLPAVSAAVRGGHVQAMHMLLAALQDSGQVSNAAQLGDLQADLLVQAMKAGSRSACCARALLQLCEGPAMQRLVADRLPRTLPTDGDASLISDFLTAVATHSRQAAHSLAMRSGLLHMLPLLRRDGMDNRIEARDILNLAPGWMVRGPIPEHQLQLVAQAMLRVRHQGSAYSLWSGVLVAVMRANSTAGLQAIWAAFAAPDVAVQDRALLAEAMHPAFSTAGREPGIRHEAMRWVLENVANQRGSFCWRHGNAVESMLLREGHKELLPVLYTSCGARMRVAPPQQWQLEGQVLWAVRHADVPAVQAAISALQARSRNIDEEDCLRRALVAATGLPDAATAAAVARLLLAALVRLEGMQAGGRGDEMLRAFSMLDVLPVSRTAVLRVLAESLPEVRACVTSSHYCTVACAMGDVDTAHWMVAQPHQQHTYLAGVCFFGTAHRAVSYFTIHCGVKFTNSFIQLLHRLSIKPSDGVDRCPDTGSVGGSDGSSSLGSSGDSDGSSGSSSSGSPAAGARKLTAPLLHAVLAAGEPDLLHALLVFMDAWSPMR